MFDSMVTGDRISKMVGYQFISIVEQHYEYLQFFAEALRRNLANPALPYFSKEVLEQREIVITVERRYTIEQNYDIGSYRSYYYKIRCGNILINTKVRWVEITSNGIEWRRGYDFCEFYPPEYELDENPNAQAEANARCQAFLDKYEADLPKLHIIRDFESRCQAINPEAKYYLNNIGVFWGRREIQNGCESISFYICKHPLHERLQCELFRTSFNKLHGMDARKILAELDML